MMYHQYNVDGVLTPLNQVLVLAGEGKLRVVGTSTQTIVNDTIITSHFTTNPSGVSEMTFYSSPKPVEYKQRFNKKVAMA